MKESQFREEICKMKFEEVYNRFSEKSLPEDDAVLIIVKENQRLTKIQEEQGLQIEQLRQEVKRLQQETSSLVKQVAVVDSLGARVAALQQQIEKSRKTTTPSMSKKGHDTKQILSDASCATTFGSSKQKLQLTQDCSGTVESYPFHKEL